MLRHGFPSAALTAIGGAVILVLLVLGFTVSAVSIQSSRRSLQSVELPATLIVILIIGALVAWRDVLDLGGNGWWRFVVVGGSLIGGMFSSRTVSQGARRAPLALGTVTFGALAIVLLVAFLAVSLVAR